MNWKTILVILNKYIEKELGLPGNSDFNDGYNEALDDVRVIIMNTIMGCDPKDGVDLTVWKDNKNSV